MRPKKRARLIKRIRKAIIDEMTAQGWYDDRLAKEPHMWVIPAGSSGDFDMDLIAARIIEEAL